MFVPKWVLLLLFLVAIGSTVGFLILLTRSSGSVLSTHSPSPSTRIVVSSSPQGSPVSSVVPSSSSISASAEWKKYTADSMDVKFEFPDTWTVSATESSTIRIASDVQPSGEQLSISIGRDKRPSSKSKLTDYRDTLVASLKKSNDALVAENISTPSINDYDSVGVRVTQSGSGEERYILFATRNYFYTIRVIPSNSSIAPVVDDVLKSITII